MPGPHTTSPSLGPVSYPSGEEPHPTKNGPNKPNEGRIAAEFPDTVIQRICEELEHASVGEVSPQSIASQKHLRNCDILAVSCVCKNWRWIATSLTCLWRNIAFDIEEPKSIGLASDFLSLVKDLDVPLHIYASFGHKKLPDPQVANLLGDLRSTTPRWVIFEYEGSLRRYVPYLDLPAPNLRYLLGHNSSFGNFNLAQLFNGHTPSLRHLLTPSARGWDSAMLSNLTEFHLSQPIGGPSVLFSSLFYVFQSTPGLETLRLDWLESIIRDSPAGSVVSLPRLRTLQIFNTNFEALADYISTPNIREATFTIDAPTHPLFQDDNALAAFSSIPILDQQISEILVVVANTAFEGLFQIRMKTSKGSSFDLRLAWGAGILLNWKSYIGQTLSVLETRVRLDPGAVLHLFLGIYPPFGIYPSLDMYPSLSKYPSLVSPSQMEHKIQGVFAQGLLRMLADDKTPPVVPIPLTYRLLIDGDAWALDEDETEMLRLCLQSRAACEVGLFIRLRHGTSPWLCAADYECPDQCGDRHHFVQLEFHPLEDDRTHSCPAPCPFLLATNCTVVN